MAISLAKTTGWRRSLFSTKDPTCRVEVASAATVSGYQGPELGVKVVRNVQGRVTETLGHTGLVPPSRHGWRDRGVHAESKREHLSSHLRCSVMKAELYNRPIVIGMSSYHP